MASNFQTLVRNNPHFSEEVEAHCKELLSSTALNQSPINEKIRAYAIDDADTKDVDDAIAIEKFDDYFVLHVLITDAAALIPLESVLGEEAKKRGSTLYLPDGRVPMLPRVLSEGILSLGEGKSNQVLDFRIALTADFRPYDVRIELMRVPDIRSVSYARADQILADPTSCEDKKLADDLLLFQELSAHYQKERIRQGAMIWQPNEYKLQVDDEENIRVSPVPLDSPARSLVAECMIMAGAMTARFCAQNSIPTVFRVQSNAARKRKRKDLSSRPSIAEIYDQFRGMKPANLKIQPDQHSGLGVEQYVQITSPIRRYQDLVLHTQLRAYAQRGKPAMRAQAILDLFSELEERQRSNGRAMRRSRNYWALRYYAGKVGGIVEGEVTEVDHRVAKVFLLDTGYIAHWIPGRSVSPGEVVKLKITAVDAENQHLILFPA